MAKLCTSAAGGLCFNVSLAGTNGTISSEDGSFSEDELANESLFCISRVKLPKLPIWAKIGDCLDGTVTCIDGVDKVFVLMKDDDVISVELKAILSSIYNTDHSPLYNPHKGSLCVALSECDEEYHRAVVLDRVDRESFQVYFIDIGAREIVEKEEVKTVDPSLFRYPPLAVPCRLAGVPLNGDVHTHAHMVVGRPVTLRMEERYKSSYMVGMEMEMNGERINVVDILLGPSKPDASAPFALKSKRPRFSSSGRDLNSFYGYSIPTPHTPMENGGESVQRNRRASVGNKNNRRRKMSASFATNFGQKDEVGGFGQPTRWKSTGNVSREESSDSQNVRPSSSEEECDIVPVKMLEEVHVKAIEGERIVPLSPVEPVSVYVHSDCGSSPDNFYLTLRRWDEDMSKVERVIKEEMFFVPMTKIEVGRIGVARYHGGPAQRCKVTGVKDGGKTAEVIFVDRGLQETVKSENIYEVDLSEKLLGISPLSVKCELGPAVPPAGEYWSAEALLAWIRLLDTRRNKQVKARIFSQNASGDAYLVDLKIGEGKEEWISEFLIGKGLATSRPLHVNLPRLRNAQVDSRIELGKEYKVICTYDVGPDQFFLGLSQWNKDLEELTFWTKRTLQFGFPPKMKNPQVGSLGLAAYDKVYYRARVTSLPSDQNEGIGVFFIDYGNSELVDDILAPKTEGINDRKARESEFFLKKLPKLCVECKLAGVDPMGENWSKALKIWKREMAPGLAGDSAMRARFLEKECEAEGGRYLVELVVKDPKKKNAVRSMADILVELGLATRQNTISSRKMKFGSKENGHRVGHELQKKTERSNTAAVCNGFTDQNGN